MRYICSSPTLKSEIPVIESTTKEINIMTPSLEVFHNENTIYESVNNDLLVDLQRNYLPVSEKFSNNSSASSENRLSKELIGKALCDQISKIDHESCNAGDEDSFFVCDLGEVYRSFKLWKHHLPMVHPHYAVKCNTDINVINLLSRLGAGFDCASKNEIDVILGSGVTPERIVYANPCKTNSFIRHAREKNVNLTTVDNAQELHKLKRFHPNCGILIRLATDDETAQCRLSTKFGCTLETALEELLPLASELGLIVKGVAFHVGSGAKDFDSIYKAVRDSRAVFDRGLKDFNFPMDTLDIGGGFEKETFEQSSSMVRLSLDKFFPDEYAKKLQIKFIAEPGRFMVANAFTLATHVIARRDIPQNKGTLDNIQAMIYINDGVYGNLNCILFDHQEPRPYVLSHNGKFCYDEQIESSKSKFSIWGPTCDGLDCISNKCLLSKNVQVGDWLYFPDLGAYTSAATTSFNGFKGLAQTIYVSSEHL